MPSPEMHWACVSCTVPFPPSAVPTIQAHTVQYTLVFPQHTKFPQQCLSSVGTSISCSRSFIIFTMPRATSKFPNALQWHNFLERLHHTVLHRYRMQWLHTDGSPCDDHQFLVVSQLEIPTLAVRLVREPTVGRCCARDLQCNQLTIVHAPH